MQYLYLKNYKYTISMHRFKCKIVFLSTHIQRSFINKKYFYKILARLSSNKIKTL